LICLISFWPLTSIPAGQVGVATLFGKVQSVQYPEGLHFVNPLYKFELFDARQKTHKENLGVPSQDQLITTFDISVQYRLIADKAPSMLKETGKPADVINVHMIPLIRSLMRERGKTVKTSEEFFKQEVQARLQSELNDTLKSTLNPKGLEIQTVLTRGVTLPKVITDAVQAKKKADQEAKKEQAELAKFKVQQERREAEAQASLKAKKVEAEQIKVEAEAKATQIKTLADAEAYKIQKINDAIGSAGGNYIKLQSLEALKSISKDPTAKMYFMNGDSANPLPLMHMGDK